MWFTDDKIYDFVFVYLFKCYTEEYFMCEIFIMTVLKMRENDALWLKLFVMYNFLRVLMILGQCLSSLFGGGIIIPYKENCDEELIICFYKKNFVGSN